MTTQQTAQRLTELWRKGDWETAQKELFSNDAVSIEPYETPAFEKETKGLDKIIEKGHKFEEMVETMHGINVSEPLVADNSIALAMNMDVTMKSQERMNMTELCIYKLKEGKIISEEFYM